MGGQEGRADDGSQEEGEMEEEEEEEVEESDEAFRSLTDTLARSA